MKLSNSPLLLALALVFALSPLRAYGAIEEQPTPAPAAPPPKAPQLTLAPELLNFVEAAYPPELLAEGVGGDVLLLIDIDAEGNIERAEVLQFSHPEFVQPTLTAIAGFTFTPAEVDFQPSAIRIQYRYRFEARSPEETNPEAEAPPEPPPPPPINFQGVILEAGVREPIAGAVITINGEAVAESDAKGRFEVRGIPTGQIKVVINSPYHESYTLREIIKKDLVLAARYYLIRLSENPFQTVVRGKIERREVSRIQLSRKELEKVPGTFGDPIRVIENLPGMARTPGGLGGALLVRGANPDDSKVFVDGVEVPLIFHFGGLTSIINSEFLESIDFFPGGFSARYGEAIAGIVDVKTRDLNCEAIHGSAKTDVIDSNGYLCVPLGEWKLAAAGRRSYADLLIPIALDAVAREDTESTPTLVPVYWDYQLKAHRRTENHTFDVFSFGSKDRFKLISAGSEEDNDFSFGLIIEQHRLMIRDTFRLGPRTTLTSSIAPGYTSTRISQQSESLDLDAGFGLEVHSLEWREELEVDLFEWLTFIAGADANFKRAKIDWSFPVPTDFKRFDTPTFNFTNTQTIEEEYDSYNHGYYAEFIVQPTEGLKLIPGLRLQRFDQGPMQEVKAQPRVTARWELWKGTILKGAYGIYNKGPEPRYLSENSGNPNLVPLQAEHIVVGLEQQFTEVINLDLQLFYNQRTKLVSPSSNVEYNDGVAEYEFYNNDGAGEAYGVEALLRYLPQPNGIFYGWLSYTLSKSTLTNREPRDSRGGGGPEGSAQSERETYLSPFDQTHILTLVAQFNLPWHLELGFRFRYVSGNPFTDLMGGAVSYNADGDGFELDQTNLTRNSDRLPPFHQLDARLDRNFTFNTWKMAVFLEVINAYDAKNVEAISYSYDYTQKEPFTLLPIIPVLGVKGTF